MGCLLPDLIKNADKSLNVLAHKYESKMGNNPKLNSLYRGWVRHVETDRLFHNAAFFYDNTHELKLLLSPAVEDTEIRPSFLSHIALELLLDHLLLKNDLVYEAEFYAHLKVVDRDAVDRFLRVCEVSDTAIFFSYLDTFIEEAYVGGYREFDQITRALIHICRRLWQVDLAADQQQRITESLAHYTEHLANGYHRIFDEIEVLLP